MRSRIRCPVAQGAPLHDDDGPIPVPEWHRWARSALLAIGCALLAACAAQVPATNPAATTAGPLEVQRTITGPSLFAILPSDARDPQVEGAAEALAHVQFALADTRRCLGAKPVRLETVFAERLLVRDGVRNQVFTPDRMGPGIAAVLIEPGRSGLMVQSIVGASALQHQLPQAAFDYWRVPACRRD